LISILILTKNEQQDLPGCLKSVDWSDDIVVFDSYSTDKTREIVETHPNTRFIQRVFDDWASHQNWAVQNIKFKYPWVFYIDADERMTPQLIQSVKQSVKNPDGHIAFMIERRDYYLGAWLKHVQTMPFYIRLFQPDKIHYERPVHVITVPHGKCKLIPGYLDHYPFSKGVAAWINRHNVYSSGEAALIIENRKENVNFSIKDAIFNKNIKVRRLHQKELFYRLPFRPFIKFLILYFGKLGFLDGRAGFSYAVLQSIYEYFIVLKTRELERAQDK